MREPLHPHAEFIDSIRSAGPERVRHLRAHYERVLTDRIRENTGIRDSIGKETADRFETNIYTIRHLQDRLGLIYDCLYPPPEWPDEEEMK